MHRDSAWWYVFVFAFVATALAETFRPFRFPSSSTSRRWISNSILLVASNAALLLAYQASGIVLAFTMRAESHGLLNRMAIPYAARFAVGFAALDLTDYFSHRLFHAVALLWRVHQVHHSETDLDLTTGFRFHPMEALFTQGLSLATIALLGAPPAAVVFGSLAIVVQDFFTHANLRFPEAAARVLRLLIITPAMHRTHHSEGIAEQNTNFGTVFSLWDRMFGTYLSRTPAEAERMRCGLAEFDRGSELNAARLLALPFQRPPQTTTKQSS
jgi:sterol desaturase/sphingolipid hydroxylase (fatty acid hydroxylase superfamily)